MQFPAKLFINGASCAASDGKTLPIINPATEEILCETASATERDVDAAVAGAQRTFERSWRDCAPGKRAEILFQIANILREHAEELSQLESLSIGKPISDARDEIALGARTFEYYAGAVSRFYGQTIPVARGGFDFTLRQPMGVVAAIVPWNFPFPIAAWKVAPALAAGNCVVLKPARQSPLTALRLGELAAQTSLPTGALQVLSGSGQAMGDALVRHPLVRKISFTGSTAVGSHIMELAARDIKRVSLELGGKSPNIIFADADLEKAAASSPMSVFANTGQDCCARSRVFVERPVYEKFVELFLQSTRKIIVGDPARPDTQVGPLVSAEQREIVEGFLQDAKTPRHKILCGGDRPARKGYYLNPAVVLGCETSDRIWREEVFGPVVCIRPFDSEEQMLAEVNASPYGLSGSLWTNDLKRALRVARRVESGVLSVNSHSSVHLEAPFGGFKQSGLGRDLGMAAMEGYSELKNVYVAE
ncbi:MAG TPA: aldehyde dehydrogenase family protein [Verrucomicrobiae bacterium]|nr:aldehyde dehydrogenase family protein [Verrucomicrobiae bacterium]